MKILIAEDDSTSHRILKAVLEKWDYEVLSTYNGIEAWEKLQQHKNIQLAVLDWMMPEMSGVELIRKIREVNDLKSMYIILLTAMGQKEDIIAGLEAGANDYITKPFHRNELRVRIKVGERIVGLQAELQQRIRELQEALDQIKTLKGLIPMCAGCKKIRDDRGYWQQVEEYLLEHSKAAVSHGLCPDCIAKYYPEYSKIKAKKNV